MRKEEDAADRRGQWPAAMWISRGMNGWVGRCVGVSKALNRESQTDA